MNVVIVLLSAIGAAIAGYAYWLEQRLRKNVSYKPICDISDAISCSKPIKSEYGKLFGVSNALIGILFYSFMALLAVLGQMQLLVYGSAASLFASAVLAYLLYFKIRSVCLLCSALYVINILIFAIVMF